MPGRWRTGPIDTIGFDGAMTIVSAPAERVEDGRRSGVASPAKRTPRTGTSWRRRTK